MKPSRLAALAALAAAALAAFTVAGCSKKKNPVTVQNIPPEVRLTNAPVDTTQEYYYSYKLNWIGFDPDGRVDHFEYAIDPTDQDTAWVRTVKNEQIFSFRASRPESLGSAQPQGHDFHTFVIRAIDNLGARSPVVYRSFFSFTVAPTVRITQPVPSHLLERRVTPVVTIKWEGHDPDGVFTQKPVKYKFKLFKFGEEQRIDTWLQHPDSLRIAFAPNFAGWDSSSADTTFHQFTNLTPDSRYLFVVVAFDEAGAYSPVFSLDTNMLRLQVGFAGQLGPVISLFNSFFFYTYGSGGFATDDSRVVHLDVPAATPQHDQPLAIGWFAQPPDESGGAVAAYRWTMDIHDLADEAARTNEQTDLQHWSQWGSTNVFALLGTYDVNGQIHGFTGIPNPGAQYEEHDFYVEAQDVNGFISIGIVHFRVIRPNFGLHGDNGLLIVNDTRLALDQRSQTNPDSIGQPSGGWPTKAELDTFLFARGVGRWRMTPSPQSPAPPGVFSGYAFDTITTRTGKENPTIPLADLATYAHIIWYVDGYASQFAFDEIGGDPTNPLFPETTLRYMASPNHQNTLAAWVTQGGRLWLFGGGIAYATTAPYDNRGNNVLVKTFRSDLAKPDLVSGRFMYDVAHWQAEFKCVGGVTPKFKRVDQPEADYSYQEPYPGIPLRRTHPEYQFAPTELLPKSPDTDPMTQYPNRNSTEIYRLHQPYYVEFLAEQENRIQETVPSHTGADSTYDTLDTLYLAWAPYSYFDHWGDVSPHVCNPVMTIYRGHDFPNPVIFQGFDLWNFQKPQLIQLVDFVLNNVWGIPRPSRSLAGAHPAALSRPAAAPPGTRLLWPAHRPTLVSLTRR